MAARFMTGSGSSVGPFLTLLLLVMSSRTGRTYDCMLERHWPQAKGTATAEITETSSSISAHATALGPFLTLILTMHRRGPEETRQRPARAGAQETAPSIRICTST